MNDEYDARGLTRAEEEEILAHVGPLPMCDPRAVLAAHVLSWPRSRLAEMRHYTDRNLARGCARVQKAARLLERIRRRTS